jgi:hypothetical protein
MSCLEIGVVHMATARLFTNLDQNESGLEDHDQIKTSYLCRDFYLVPTDLSERWTEGDVSIISITSHNMILTYCTTKR